MSDDYNLRDDFDDMVLLAHGGMGAVYLAKQRSLNRMVVIKTILSGERIPVESSRRLISEGQLLAKLAHPNIVTVYDLKQTQNEVYLIEEHVQGTDLRYWMKARTTASTKMTPEVFWHLVKQIISALDAAHSVGIIHRDLKPDNILIKEDLSIKLCDFGISTITTESARQMSSSSGTLAYMAPELFDDTPVISKALDYYSLGCIVYELLCEMNPFLRSTDDSIGRIIKAKLTNAVLDFRALPLWFLKHQDALKGLLALEPAARKGAFDQLSDLATSEDPAPLASGSDTQATMTAVDFDLRRYIASGSLGAADDGVKNQDASSSSGSAVEGAIHYEDGATPRKINWYKGIRRIVLTLAALFSLACLVGLVGSLWMIVPHYIEMWSNPNYSKWVKLLADPELPALSSSEQEQFLAMAAKKWGLKTVQTDISVDKGNALLFGLAIPALWAVLFLLRWFLRGFITTDNKQTPISRKSHRGEARRHHSGESVSIAQTPQSWICPKCSKANVASSRTCGQCGYQQETMQSIMNPLKLRGWKCPRCAISNTEFARTCESCGLVRP